MESGIRLMLAPRSARAKHSSNSGKSHGIRNLPGSPNFSGNVFRMTAEQFSLTGVLVNSKILSLLFKSFLNIGANLGMCKEHLRSNITMWRFRKISMNFKAKRSSFSRTFSLFTLDGYGKVVLVLGMTTGSSTWTIEVGTSFGILTEAPWSFVTVVPLPSPLRDVFLDIVTINVAIGGWTILVRMTTPASYTTLLDCFYRSGSWSLVFLIENQCSNHIFRQQTSDEQLVVEDSYSLLKQSLASVIDELWTCLIDDY
ncbi:hypothetical protein Tco_0456513 [Tanacetum coccineum]